MPCGFEYSALGSHRIDDLLIGSPYCALHLDAESDQGIALIYEHCPASRPRHLRRWKLIVILKLIYPAQRLSSPSGLRHIE
jgi:hypothetical protein